jgi:hypothetical protein
MQAFKFAFSAQSRLTSKAVKSIVALAVAAALAPAANAADSIFN